MFEALPLCKNQRLGNYSSPVWRQPVIILHRKWQDVISENLWVISALMAALLPNSVAPSWLKFPFLSHYLFLYCAQVHFKLLSNELWGHSSPVAPWRRCLSASLIISVSNTHHSGCTKLLINILCSPDWTLFKQETEVTSTRTSKNWHIFLFSLTKQTKTPL